MFHGAGDGVRANHVKPMQNRAKRAILPPPSVTAHTAWENAGRETKSCETSYSPRPSVRRWPGRMARRGRTKKLAP